MRTTSTTKSGRPELRVIFSGKCRALRMRFLLAVLAAGALSSLAASSHAATRTWSGRGSGFPARLWSDPNNWDPVGLPQNGDDLRFFLSDISANDLTNLVVNSLIFDTGDDYFILGNTIAIANTSSGYAIHIDFLSGNDIHVVCGLKLAADATFQAGQSIDSGVNKLRLEGPIDLNGHKLYLRAQETATGNDSGGTGEIYLSGEISGDGDILAIAEHRCSMEFNGPGNSFHGEMAIEAMPGSQILLNTSPGVIAAESVRIQGYTITKTGAAAPSGVVKYGRSDQIGDSASVLIVNSGRLQFDDHSDSIANLIISTSTNDDFPTALETGQGTLTVNGSISSHGGSGQTLPYIDGKLGLGEFVAITVSGFAFEIKAPISGNGFEKLGPGALRLSGINTFSGNVRVTEGKLEALSAGAFGQSASVGVGVHLNGGNLVLQNVAIGGERLFVDSSASLLTAIGACSWAGPVTLSADLQVAALDPAFSTAAFDISGSIAGSGGLDLLAPLVGIGSVRLSGSSSNTFTGPLTVNCQRLELSKPSGVHAYSGPLIVGRPGASGPSEVRWLNAHQQPGRAVTLYSNAFVNLNGFNDDFGAVNFNGGRIDTGNGQIAIYQPLTVNSGDSTAVINGFVALPPNEDGVFIVTDGPADCDLLINAVVVGTPPHLVKRGQGTMRLTGASTYFSTTLVQEGILDAANGAALGQPAGTSVSNNATLRLSGAGTMTRNFQIVGAGFAGTHGVIEVPANSSFTVNGSVLMDTNSTINIGQSAGLAINGVISGPAALTKSGPGNLTLSGGANNTYTGDTVVAAGTLFFSKSSSRIAVPGNLILGPASASANAVARLLQSGGLGGSIATVYANSLLDLNGFNLTLAQLNLNDGGDLQTGAGTLTFASGGVVSVGSFLQFGPHASSSLSGNIGLPANDILTFNVRPYAPFPPFDFRPELDVAATIPRPNENVSFVPAGIRKEGSGHLRLAGANTFLGNTTVNGGTLQVDGTQPQCFAVINPAGRLQGTGTVGHVFIYGGSSVVAPGLGAGTLTCSNFNAGAGGGGVLQIQLSGTTLGTGYDQLNVRGSVNLSGIALDASLSFPSAVSNQFLIINNDGIDPVAGTFTGLPQNATLYISGEKFSISYTGGTGNDVVLTRLPTPPRPVLTIERIPPDSVRLLWPTNAADFHLQFNTNLAAANWTLALPAPVVVGTNEVVTNAANGAQRFYRLSTP